MPGLRRVAADLKRALPVARARLRHRDVALLGAGLTFYAAIAVVPALVIALRLAAALVGTAELSRLADSLAGALPDALGAPRVARDLVDRGARMSLAAAAVAVIPATVYGEGLRRAFGVLADRRERLVGWRGRVRVFPLLLLAPALVLAVLLVTPLIDRLFRDGAGPLALGVYLAFLVDWVVVSLALVYTYRVVTPVSPSRGAVLLGAFTTGSFVAGFLQGFILFLALPLDLGAPFAGLDAVGAAVAVGLWLWVLHILVLAGHELTRALDSAPR